jgi:hypothetical protein
MTQTWTLRPLVLAALITKTSQEAPSSESGFVSGTGKYSFTKDVKLADIK